MKMLTSRFEIKSLRLPSAFDGFTIAHVSDLHNREFGNLLTDEIAAQNPDCIVITGDMIHRENQIAAAIRFAEKAVRLAPTYYVTGNHERVLRCYDAFAEKMRALGVHILANSYATVRRGEDKIAFLGMHDPTFFERGKIDFVTELSGIFAHMQAEGILYTILLSHRPELFERYVATGIDLSLCGHAHGGHVRFPFIGAVYAPGQGLFPKYTEGIYRKDGKCMVVSKGLGKSSWVPRVLNPPELAVEILCVAQESVQQNNIADGTQIGEKE